jgi:putative (di)nucleoside polyphosphate hydrolase
MSDHIDDEGFRANVGIVLMQDDGRVFLGRRVGGKGWQFPQGGVRIGESLEQAMFRELGEEIGLTADDVEVLAVTRRWLRYRLPPRFVRRDQSPVCVGQKQRWYLLRSRAAAPAFRFDTTGEPEFADWRWADYWEPVREVIHFKRQVYRRALQELGREVWPEGLPPYPAWWGAMSPSDAAPGPAKARGLRTRSTG